MKIATAAPEHPVSYGSSRVDGLELDLFYDHQNNVKSYPKWQQRLRDHQPPLLVLWGRYDTSFTVAGGEAYRRDDPHAEVHILDAGHFAPGSKSERDHPINRRLHEKCLLNSTELNCFRARANSSRTLQRLKT